MFWPLIQPVPPVPEQVKAYWQPGTITVVEVTDFECPYCRETHTVLADFLEEYGDRLTFVRLVQPMEQHANARHAARAHLCSQGQSHKMAEALFSAEDLSAEECERLAESLRLDMERYRACITDATTDQRIDELTDWLDEREIGGLPVIWVQNQRLLGNHEPAGISR